MGSLPKGSPALKTLNDAGSRPVYYVTTDSGKQVLVAQLSDEDLAKAEASIKAHPSLMKGHDAHVLSALGLSGKLSKTPYKPGGDIFTTGLPKSKLEDVEKAQNDLKQRSQSRLAEAQVTATARQIATIEDPQAREYMEAQLAKFKQKSGLTTKKSDNVPLPTSPSSVAALNAYFAQVRAVAARNKRLDNNQKAKADSQFRASLRSIGRQYDVAVADENIEKARTGSGTTKLLSYDSKKAEHAAKQAARKG